MSIHRTQSPSLPGLAFACLLIFSTTIMSAQGAEGELLGPCEVMEGEPVCSGSYVDTFNGGCEADEHMFSTIEFDRVLCARSGVFKAGLEGSRDSDWYQIQVDEPTRLTWVAEAAFPIDVSIISAAYSCGEGPPTLASKEARGQGQIERATVTEPVQPGTYWLFVAPSTASDFAQCGASYKALLTREDYDPPLPVAAVSDGIEVEVVSHWDEHPEDYQAADLWADDRGYAYVGNRLGATVDIMNVQNPAAPFLEAVYQVPPPDKDSVAKDIKVFDGIMYVALDEGGFAGAQIVDVRDPSNPTLLTSISILEFSNVHNLFYDNGYLYMVNSFFRTVVIVDLSDFDPDNPPATITQFKWRIDDIGQSFVHDVTVLNGLMYASAWDGGLWVYNVTDVANTIPTFVASVPGDNTHAAWPSEDGRWIVTNEERISGGPVKLHEMTPTADGFHLEHVFTYAIPTSQSISSHNVYVVGRRVYVAWYARGMMVFDIVEESKSLKLVGHYDTSPEPTEGFLGVWGVYPFQGRSRVMVSDKETQLWIFDVRIPGSGDFDGNAVVNTLDLPAMLECGAVPGAAFVTPDCDVFDFDGDGDVDFADYGAMQIHVTQ